jgi:hypothetical protein
MIPRTGQNETFNRYANGVRAHADGVGVKQPNLSLRAVRGIFMVQGIAAEYGIETRRAGERKRLAELRWRFKLPASMHHPR